MSTQGEKDYYDILEVSRLATPDEIRSARNLKLKFFHPDRYQHDPELRAEAERKTKEINRAYEVLSDPINRSRYDRERGYAPLEETRLAESYDQALLLLSQHKWQGAIGRLEQILAIDPEYRDAARLLQLARAAQQQEAGNSGAPAATTPPSAAGSYCWICGAYGRTWKVTYRQNIGALFVRFHKKLPAELCRSCAGKYFWEYSLTTLFLGWWGVISAIVTPFFLLGNVISYLPSMTRGKRALFLTALIGIPLILCLWSGGAFGRLGDMLAHAFDNTASNPIGRPTHATIPASEKPRPQGGDLTPPPPPPTRTPTRPPPTPGSAGADRVIAFNPGPGANAAYGKATDILGTKNGIEKPDYRGFVQLGKGGSILVAFTDNSIVDTVGDDFWVYGESVGDDYLRVEVSENGWKWYSYQKVSESPAAFDLAKAGFSKVVYVRLTDVQPGTSTGAEVDAVVAFHSGPGVGVGLPTLPGAFARSDLVLREGPSSKMKEVGRVTAPANVDVLGRDKSATWMKIRALLGQTGWCKASELALNVSLSSLAVAAGPPQ